MSDSVFEGSIKLIEETQTFKGDFKKREFVVSTNDTYPQHVKFEIVGDNVDHLDSFSVGDNIKVAYLVRGNEYNGKYYVNLRAIAIGLLDEDGKAKMAKAPVAKSKPIVTQVDEDDDDLPF
jgi:hypothetical protein